MEIERLLEIEAENEIEKLVMILSNNTDYGSTKGGMISAANFYKCAEQLMAWHKMELKKIPIPDVNRSICDH